MASSESLLIIQDRLERRHHYEATSCYLAKHWDTIYKDIPVNHLIPLAFYVKMFYLKTTDFQLLISLICKKYNYFNLFSDWQKYCKALDPGKRVIATLEGALFFAAEYLPPLDGRESWKSSCLCSFYSLKAGNDVVSGQKHVYCGSEEGLSDVMKSHPVVRSEILPQSLDNQLAISPVSHMQIKPLCAQQEANGNLSHDYPVPPSSKHASTESPGLPNPVSMKITLEEPSKTTSIAAEQELDDAAPLQVMTTEHQQQDMIPRTRKQTTESVASGGRPHKDDDRQEKIKLIKRSHEIDYKGSSMPVDNLPLLIRRLLTAMGSSK